MAQPHLQSTGLVLNFGDYCAIDNLSFDVASGEFFVLLGPSGCGKSTLLRAITGLETLDAGELVISGKDVVSTHPRDRNIAMIFQNYALYPHMTVRKNIAYPLHVAGMSKKAQKTTVGKVADLLELTPYLDRKPAELSGGQRQRVAMGRALVREPEMFLMDEPLSNLDAKLRQQMRVELKSLQKKLGITTIYVTHDQVEAMTMADRIMIMNGGRIEQVGKPKEVYATPASLFVAAFIGSPPMNFLREPELARRLCQHYNIDHPVDDVVLAIRPEHIRRANETDGIEQEDGKEIHINARCVAAEGLGAETLCHLELKLPNGGISSTDYTSHTSNTVTAKWYGDFTELADTDLQLTVANSSVLLYSAKTEALLSPPRGQQHGV